MSDPESRRKELDALFKNKSIMQIQLAATKDLNEHLALQKRLLEVNDEIQEKLLNSINAYTAEMDSHIQTLNHATSTLQGSSTALEKLTSWLIRLTYALLLIGGLSLLQDSLHIVGASQAVFWTFALIGTGIVAFLVYVALFKISKISKAKTNRQ